MKTITLTLAALTLTVTTALAQVALGTANARGGQNAGLCPGSGEIHVYYDQCLRLANDCLTGGHCNKALARQTCLFSHQNLVPADRCVQNAIDLLK